MSTGNVVKRQISRKFKLSGLAIRADAVKALASALSQEDDVDGALTMVLGAIKARIERQEIKSALVDLAAVTAVVADLTKDEKDVASEAITLVDAFAMPVLRYHSVRKCFFLDEGARPLHAGPELKARVFRERFELVQQRVLRHKSFAKPLVGGGAKAKAGEGYIELTPLDSLLGAAGQKCLLGMITQQEEGQYYLEDLTTSIRIDMTKCKNSAGIFTEGCIVLAEGELEDGTFVAKQMGFPPPETRHDTMRAMGPTQMDVLGTNFTAQHFAEMQALEDKSTDAMFVLVSDCHLDRPAVFEKIRTMLEGFAPLQPALFVFLGNFTSQPIGYGGGNSLADYVRHFDNLARLLLEFPALVASSRFVFVPGPNDPGSANVLPRPPLPAFFTQRMRDRVPSASFATNPCRLRFFTQEIVIFREEILHKMRRNAIMPPVGDMQVTEHLVKTLCGQAHLCPLPLAARPIYWAHDHALRLYPLPDVLILADRTEQYQWRYEDTAVLNPGAFAADFSFVVYRPATRETEFSRIDGDE